MRLKGLTGLKGVEELLPLLRIIGLVTYPKKRSLSFDEPSPKLFPTHGQLIDTTDRLYVYSRATEC